MIEANATATLDLDEVADAIRLATAILAGQQAIADMARVEVPCAGGPANGLVTAILAADGRQSVLVLLSAPLLDLPSLQARYKLTPRELEVGTLLARRCSNKEIARLLDIRQRTASRHTENVMRKLGVRDRLDAARRLASAPSRYTRTVEGTSSSNAAALKSAPDGRW